MAKLDILIIGKDARAHALAWKLRQSPRAGRIYVAPGNAGTSEIAENVSIAEDNLDELVAFAGVAGIDLTVVGPEEPLKLGIVDRFRAAGLRIFGPTSHVVWLETSKARAKRFNNTRGIPTAHARSFSSVADAQTYVRSVSLPCVIKADGLASGKGVVICRTRDRALTAIHAFMVRRIFGASGERILVEEFLEGQEVSVHVVSDGLRYAYLSTAQDHKHLNDGDRGPMTGGMGVIAPVPWVTRELLEEIDRSVGVVLNGLREQGTPFIGCLFIGFMVTADGPKVLEYNVRFGDPEAEAIFALYQGDLLELLFSCTAGNLCIPVSRRFSHAFPDASAASIVLAAPGYPQAPKTGVPITIDREGIPWDDVQFFHANTRMGEKGLVTAGGRAIVVTIRQPTLKKAISRAYTLVERVSLKGKQFRRDIGAKALERCTK
jgi:phosphoribosylamine--glycine ligase